MDIPREEYEKMIAERIVTLWFKKKGIINSIATFDAFLLGMNHVLEYYEDKNAPDVRDFRNALTKVIADRRQQLEDLFSNKS